MPPGIFYTAVIAVVLFMGWLNAGPAAALRNDIRSCLMEQSSIPTVRVYTGVDQAFARYARNGNVVLRFPNANAADQRQADTIQFLYFRSAYSIYPHRVFCGDTNNVISFAEDVTRIHFDPSDEWLDSHNVSTIVTYSSQVDQAGQLHVAHTAATVTRDSDGKLVRGPEITEPDPTLATTPPEASSPAVRARSATLAGAYAALVLALGYSTLCLVYAGIRTKPENSELVKSNRQRSRSSRPSGPKSMRVSRSHDAVRLSLIAVFGLSAALGMGAMGMLLLWASLVGLRPSRGILAFIAVTLAVLLAILWSRNALVRIRWPAFKLSVRDWPLIVPFALLSYVLTGVALVAIVAGWLDWDGFAIWGLKAKVLLHESLAASPAYFHDSSLRFSSRDYPLLLPFLTSGFYAALGHVDDHLDKLMRPFVVAALGALTFFGLRWKLSRGKSFWLTAALLATPAASHWAGWGGVDIPLTLFYSGSIFFLVKWLEEDTREDLIMAALFTAFAAMIKNEGQAIALINGGVLWIYLCSRRQSGRVFSGLKFVAVVSFLLLPWLLWSRSIPRTVDMSVAKLLSGLPHFWGAFSAILAKLDQHQTFGGLWWLLVLAACVGWKAFRAPGTLLLWMLLLAHLLLYAAVYMVIWDLPAVWSTSGDRVLLHATPAAIYLIGWHWAYVSPEVSASTQEQPVGMERIQHRRNKAEDRTRGVHKQKK